MLRWYQGSRLAPPTVTVKGTQSLGASGRDTYQQRAGPDLLGIPRLRLIQAGGHQERACFPRDTLMPQIVLPLGHLCKQTLVPCFPETSQVAMSFYQQPTCNLFCVETSGFSGTQGRSTGGIYPSDTRHYEGHWVGQPTTTNRQLMQLKVPVFLHSLRSGSQLAQMNLGVTMISAVWS